LSIAYDISNKLGRLDAICVIGIDFAKLLLATGHKAEAIAILTRSRDGFLRLGMLDDAQQVRKIIDSTADDS
jgi:hypothetical protein